MTHTLTQRTVGFVAVLCIASGAFAAANRWSSSGPEGALITQILTDPDDANVAYAVAQSVGVFKTSDGGRQWRSASEGIPVGFVTALLVVPDAPAILYAVTSDRVFISTDGAEHWSPRGRVGSFVNSLTFDSSSGTLYAATQTGLFISTDEGTTWAMSGPFKFATSVAVLRNGTAYAAAGMSSDPPQIAQLFHSTDRGQTWTAVNSFNSVPYRVVVDLESSTIYIRSGNQVFASTDDAQSWHHIPEIPHSLPNEPVPITSIVPAGAGHLYASTNSGVFEYSERSGAWTQVGSANSDKYLFALAVTSSTPRRFYSAYTEKFTVPKENSGIVISLENQTDWTPANRGLPGPQTRDVAVVRSEPAIAYATADFGIFKTEDAGESWQSIRSGWPQRIEISPADSNTVLASMAGAGILKTTDAGKTWRTVSTGTAWLLAIAQSDPATVYATASAALEKSADRGETWSIMGLPVAYSYYGETVTALAVDPTNPATAYVSKDDGTFKTTDGGQKWQEASSVSNLYAFAIDPSDPSIIYAATYAGLQKSVDGGTTWTSAGLINKTVRSVTINGAVLYAGTADGHVYRSSDGGQFWSGLDDGLTRASVWRIAVDATGDHLYAATTAGVYEYHTIHDDARFEPLPDDPLRLPRLFIGSNPNSGFVFPVVGTTKGIGASVFTTEINLTNNGDSDQELVAAFLPLGSRPDDAMAFRLTLHPGTLAVSDVAERLGFSGIGTLAVFALDPNASIDGSARIWTHPADGRAPLSQQIPAVRSPMFADHVRAEANGLRQDSEFRTNVGIVNLSGEVHQFTVQVNGERASHQFTIAAPPFSLVQVPLPQDDYGALSLDVFADTATHWLFYGSTIESASGEAVTTVGMPLGR